MAQSDELIDDLEASLYAAARRRTLIARALVALVMLGVLATLAFVFKRPLRRALFGLQTSMRAGPELTDDQAALADVHSEHLPMWSIAQSRIGAGGEPARERADDAFATLSASLDGFPAAAQLMADLREDTLDPTLLAERNDAITSTVTAWNQLMSSLGRPWWIDGTVLIHRGDPAQNIFYIKTYRVLGDTSLTVDGAPYRTRLVARADHTNVVESMLGHASPHQDGAIILADRLYDFANRDLWPLLDPALDAQRQPLHAAFAPKARAELLALLSEDAAAKLTATAAARFALVEAVHAVGERAKCGSTFRIYDLPWDGISEDYYEPFRNYARDDVGKPCPSITKEEAEAIISSSEALKDSGIGLRDAVGELVAIAARKVSVHEARHSADHATANAFDTPLPCEPCGEHMSRSARAELSAYAATFAHPGTAYVALLQACSLDRDRGTPHARALRTLLPRLSDDDACTTPPENLSERSRDAELYFFGRAHAIAHPADFPTRLELYERRK